ncbi:MAG TPA: alpha/beta hydrolase [Meiothermus sp.]|jgi:pimeloyl-ACP methyl ester carboxylesterase|nr:alpha/beta hydrolase [Meiothermus sp.]
MTGHDAQTRQARSRLRLWQNPTPVLVVQGECDYEVAEEYRRTFANATLIPRKGAGHLISLERFTPRGFYA